MSSPSTLYAETFVDALIEAGLRHVCFVPGSRHTPLILAFARHKENIHIYSHLDERSAAFFALGLALASDEPAAVVCTSGSAGANFFPAIVEAHQSHVPLIVLTADRPHELRQSGANQTIDQIKMFGDYALWFYDMPLPEANPPDVARRNIRTIAARTFARATGIRKGVVHINLPFRKPLEPTEADKHPLEQHHTATRLPEILSGKQIPDEHYVELIRIFEEHRNGMVIAGPNAASNMHYPVNLIAQFAEHFRYPLIADGVSGVRFGEANSIGGYETFLSKPADHVPEPTVIVRFGNVPTSKWLNQYIATLQPEYYIHIDRAGEWSDDSHLVTHNLQAEFTPLLMEPREIARESAFSQGICQLEKNTWQIIDHEIAAGEYFDGAVVYDVVDLLPDGSTLFAGNSLPVRHLDQFGKPQEKHIYTYANRGASGIDGNISTALGTGAARPDKPLVAVLGDITFYHDMNGLLAVHRCGVPVTIVLLNNDGGGIFHRLPINQFDPEFTDYFITAHGLDYSHTAKLYGLDYVRVDDRATFRQAFTESVRGRSSTIIEFRSDGKQDLKRRNAIVAAVHEQLKTLKF